MPDDLEAALEDRRELALGTALQHLGDQGAALGQELGGDLEGGLGERRRAHLVGGAVAGGGRRHVAQNHVRGPAQRGAERCRRALGEEVLGEHPGALERRHLGRVDRQHSPAAGLSGLDPLDRHLAPAPRGGAQVDAARARAKEKEALVALDELDGGARAVALGARLGDVGVLELAPEPARRRELAALGGLQPRASAAAARAALTGSGHDKRALDVESHDVVHIQA